MSKSLYIQAKTSKDSKRVWIATLLLTIFLGYFTSTHFFYHTHIVDGVAITHSHPFADLGKNYSHSSSDFKNIAMLSFYVFLVSTCIFLPQLFALKKYLQLSYTYNQQSRKTFAFSLRAPPIFLAWHLYFFYSYLI